MHMLDAWGGGIAIFMVLTTRFFKLGKSLTRSKINKSIYVIGSAESGDPSKKKKKVTWAVDDNLTMVRYFELDESERGN